MTVPLLSFILGGILLLAGIIGGGIEVKELKIPRISGATRGIATLSGFVFVVLGFVTPAPESPTPQRNSVNVSQNEPSGSTGDVTKPQPPSNAPRESSLFAPQPESVFFRGERLFKARKFVDAVPLLKEAALAGNSEAARYLGDIYSRNVKGVERDFGEARTWYERAVPDSAAAMDHLGDLYDSGKGVEFDLKTASDWYLRSARKGSPEGMADYGLFVDQGRGFKKDPDVARGWFKQARSAFEVAIAKGDLSMCVWLGRLHYEGRGGATDFVRAFQLYKQGADSGDPYAMSELGRYYEDGKGGELDLSKAHYWFTQASAAGDSSATAELGWLYESGKGVRKDCSQASSLYEQAAAEGNGGAMRLMALFYERGSDHGCWPTKDYAQALSWYKKAALAGDEFSMLAIGVYYQGGFVGKPNFALAREWMQKALDAGSADAEANLKSLR
jgi:TPR repeat protein